MLNKWGLSAMSLEHCRDQMTSANHRIKRKTISRIGVEWVDGNYSMWKRQEAETTQKSLIWCQNKGL